MAVTRATLRQIDRLRGDLDAVLNKTTRTLTSAWADAFDEVKADLDAAVRDLLDSAIDGRVTRTQAMRSKRLARALTAISGRLQTLADTAGVTISGDLDTIVAKVIDAQANLVATQLPAGERELVDTWSQVDERAIEAIVNRSTQAIVSSLDPLPGDVMSVVRRELIRGVSAGTNPRATARRMVARVEGHVNGRWGLSRALTIARTEQLDASRTAALESRKANADVLAGWVWLTKLDGRTCPSCLAQHGQVHDVDEAGPLDHPNGRCTAVPKTKSWADLGIDLDEPADLTPDAGAWFDGLPEADQRSILGPTRHEAWKAGDYPMSAWSQRRTASGWRDSFVVSPAPKAARRAVA